MSVANYKISVLGCDDSTHIEMHLDDMQFAIVNAVALKITAASEYGCMPIMKLERLESSETGSGE